MEWNYLSIPKLQWLYLTLYNGCNYLSMLRLKLGDLGDAILVNIGSGGLLPAWCQAITPYCDIKSIRCLGAYFSEIESKYKHFSSRKIHTENIVCKVTAILSWSQCIDIPGSTLKLFAKLVEPVAVSDLWCAACMPVPQISITLMELRFFSIKSYGSPYS